ncbi:MAG TPA: alkaline phosphatase family protein, partial [Planctomycetota bacterium]|nr:alkaline phosphatase family protein [Planctomycetota bacterium]
MNPRSLRGAAALSLLATLLPALRAQAPPAASSAPATPPAPAATGIEPPRLVVLCAVDQLATWVLDAALPHCGPDGFQRLIRDGVQFPHCAYLHGCTETGPGHATLGTGAPASVHGIVKNQWWDPGTRHFVYCADDKSAEALEDLPEGKGKGPGLLLVPTLGDLMKQQFGAAAKVVSVSWKDRAAIL